MLHSIIAKSFSLPGFILASFGLGFGGTGNFPASIKTVAEWFPKKEPAFATGIFNAATSVGAIPASIVEMVGIAENGDGWRYPFLITGVLSGLWLFM